MAVCLHVVLVSNRGQWAASRTKTTWRPLRRAAETQSSRRDRSEAEERRSRLTASWRCGPRCVTPSEYVARVLPCNSERIASPSLRGSEATKQSRPSRVKAGTDFFTYVLRTKSDESCKKLSLDRFVASLPRDDGARPPTHARPR